MKVVPVIVLLSLVVVACGSSEEDEVRSAVDGVYDALADKDARGLCEAMSDEGRKRVVQAGGERAESCKHVFEYGLALAGNQLDGADETEVTEVEVDGDKATATVENMGQTGHLTLVREDGEWKLSELATARSRRGN